jgi:hypothetical protein
MLFCYRGPLSTPHLSVCPSATPTAKTWTLGPFAPEIFPKSQCYEMSSFCQADLSLAHALFPPRVALNQINPDG